MNASPRSHTPSSPPNKREGVEVRRLEANTTSGLECFSSSFFLFIQYNNMLERAQVITAKFVNFSQVSTPVKPAPRLSTRTLPSPRGASRALSAECTFNPAKGWRKPRPGPLQRCATPGNGNAPNLGKLLPTNLKRLMTAAPSSPSTEAETALYRPAPSSPAPSPLTSGFPSPQGC